MVAVNKIIVIFASLLFLLSCQRESSKEVILFDFESEAELDQLYWNCHTLYSLSNDHATHGLRSLKMELFPSDYPGLIPMLSVTDWRRYGEFCFDVYNPSEQSLRLGVRIDDREDYPDFADRYNKNFEVKKGANHIVIPLETLTTSASRRRLNLSKIHRMFIFVNHPMEKTILYIDDMKLLGK